MGLFLLIQLHEFQVLICLIALEEHYLQEIRQLDMFVVELLLVVTYHLLLKLHIHLIRLLESCMDLSASRYGGGATGNVTVGYVGPGSGTNLANTTQDKLTYSTDTASAITATPAPHHTKLDMRCQETYLMVICLVVLPMIR